MSKEDYEPIESLFGPNGIIGRWESECDVESAEVAKRYIRRIGERYVFIFLNQSKNLVGNKPYIFSLRKRENDRLHASEARFQGYEEVKPYIVDDEEDFFPTRNIRNETYSSATITKNNIRSRSPMALPRPSQSRLHEERERGRSISPSRYILN